MNKTAVFFAGLLCAFAFAGGAQTTSFTYQGRLSASDGAANGLYDFQFRLFTAETNGAPVAGPAGTNAVPVTNGLFSVLLDFGATAFNGQSRWLEISVKNSLTDDLPALLSPRQPITPTPYALHAYNAANLMSFVNAPLDIKVDGQRALRLEPNTDSPNIIGGFAANAVSAGSSGVTIAGGGRVDVPNLVLGAEGASFAAIGGGIGNLISSYAATIAGGQQNRIEDNASTSFIGSGLLNVIRGTAFSSVIGGGQGNNIRAPFSTIAGGVANTIEEVSDSTGSAIGGGQVNTIQFDAYGSTISGGVNNTIQTNAFGSSVGGGDLNIIEAFSPHSVIAGGQQNSIAATGGTIGGGIRNRVVETGATIAGGTRNFIDEEAGYSAIGGGFGNSITAEKGTIAGGEANSAGSAYSAIGGGLGNAIGSDSSFSTIAGGEGHTIANEVWNSSIGGGEFNLIETQTDNGTIGGGVRNTIRMAADSSTIAGGERNEATAKYATVGGGGYNIASGLGAVVAGGGGVQAEDGAENRGNTAAGNWSAVLGGADNVAEGLLSVVGGGEFNHAGGNYGVVPGGFANRAEGLLSFAAGWGAQALHNGAWVWGDNSPILGGPPLASTTNNQFTARAAGGVRFFTDKDATTGAELAPGSGSWSMLSDRNAKENFARANPREVLDKLASLPLATWNYKAQGSSIRHIGPIAQDFHAAFGVGEDERRISSVDADGVALAAIQGLNQKVEQENRGLRSELAAKEIAIQELREAVAALRKLVDERSLTRR